MNWTDEKVEELKALWNAGKSGGQIAAVFGITRNAVIGKIHRLGLYREQRKQRAARAQQISPVPTPSVSPRIVSADPPFVAIPHVELEDGPPGASPRALTLMGLTSKTCRWPHGDGPFWFCGAPPLPSFPYCEGHCQKAYYRR